MLSLSSSTSRHAGRYLLPRTRDSLPGQHGLGNRVDGNAGYWCLSQRVLGHHRLRPDPRLARLLFGAWTISLVSLAGDCASPACPHHARGISSDPGHLFHPSDDRSPAHPCPTRAASPRIITTATGKHQDDYWSRQWFAYYRVPAHQLDRSCCQRGCGGLTDPNPRSSRSECSPHSDLNEDA